MAAWRSPLRGLAQRSDLQAAIACGLLCSASLGCLRNTRLDAGMDRVGQLLLDAEASGALRCAPRQLAIARSHLEFAQLERAQGFSSKAERHLLIADQHARAAKLLSPPEQCQPRSRTEQESVAP